MQNIFFVPVFFTDGCSSVSCDFGVFMTGDELMRGDELRLFVWN